MQAGPIKNLLVESFQRSLDYDRDLQDGVGRLPERRLRALHRQGLRRRAALQRGGHEGQARQFLAAYNKLRASRGLHARRRRLLTMRRRGSDRRRAARRRPGRRLRARRSARRPQTRGAGGHGDARPALVRGRAQRPARPRGRARATRQAARAESTSTPATKPRPAARDPTAARPTIVQRPIPFGAKRRDEMRAYARRHYGLDDFRLRDPKVIVEHYTVDRRLPVRLRHLRQRRARRRAARAARARARTSSSTRTARSTSSSR